MESVSGQNLGWFFQQWLRQAGHPVIQPEWRWWPKEKMLALTLRQTQRGTFFRLPIEIEIITGGAKIRHTVWMEKTASHFKLRQEVKPEHVTLDPDEKILMTQ